MYAHLKKGVLNLTHLPETAGTKPHARGDVKMRHMGTRYSDREVILGSRRDFLRAGSATLLVAAPWIGQAHAEVPPGPPAPWPHPIPEHVETGDLAADLVPIVRIPKSKSTKPYTMLNCLVPIPGRPGRAYAADSRNGVVRIVNLGKGTVVKSTLNVKAVRAGWFASIERGNDMRGGGLGSVVADPDFSRSGAPGRGRIYTIHIEWPGPAQPDVVVFHGDGSRFPVRFHNVVAEWRTMPGDWTTIDPASYREILRIAMPARVHNADTVLFDPTLEPSDELYGTLYIGVGDGINQPSHPEPFEVAQDLTSPLGKFLRIFPPCRSAGALYTVPAANPFVGRTDGTLGEIIEWGLRHPQNFWFDRATGRRYITDIGQYETFP